MVYVYVADITCLPDPVDCPYVMEGLSENRRMKIMRCKQSLGRKQRLGAGLLLKEVLSAYGVQEKHIRIGEFGKPEAEGICFSISHSHSKVVCATSCKPVGCDIEMVKEAPKGLAERFFLPQESKHIIGDEDFYRLWTMKESYMKMTGEGMHLPLNQFEIRMDERIRVYHQGKICSCNVKEYEIPEYRISVCSEELEFAPEIKLISLEKNTVFEKEAKI